MKVKWHDFKETVSIMFGFLVDIPGLVWLSLKERKRGDVLKWPYTLG
jgi:hypothetical protein